MDSINFLGKPDFPNSAQTMDMLQGIAKLAGALAMIGGSNYILTGCVENAGIVSDGIVIIGGVPYKFEGGPKKGKITIKETKETLSAFGEEYPEARTKRIVTFSENGNIKWDDIERVPTNFNLKKMFESIKGDFPGTVKMWAGMVSKIPEDYKLCNGDVLSKEDYPELFEAISYSFGGNGFNEFKLPDLRGRFIVGLNNGVDDYNAIGKIGGKEKHVLTTNELPTHNHVNNPQFNKLSARAADVNTVATPGSIDKETPDQEYNVGNMDPSRWEQATIQNVGNNQPHENRPPYFTLAYIIKVKA